MIEISFVIPAYNVELYIERCLNSIYNQDIDNSLFEVIAIDDGSTDKTLAILKEYQAGHSNMEVLTQENQGPSVARNKGIDLSRGKYIWFVDSDDYIVKDAIHKILKIINFEEIEILYFTVEVIELDKVVSTNLSQPVPKGVIIDGKTALERGFYPTSVCLALWRREYLNKKGLRFNTSIMYAEDSLFSFCSISQARRVMFIDDVLYIYEKREGSSTTSQGPSKLIKQKLSDVEVIYSIIELALKNKIKEPELSNLMNTHAYKILFGLVFSLFRNRNEYSKNGIAEVVIAKLKEKKLYPIKYNYHSIKKNVVKHIMNIERILY